MSNGVAVGNVNPLDPGNSPNSVENAAAGFDTLFADVEPDFRDEQGNPVNPDGTARNRNRRSEPRRAVERVADTGDEAGEAPDADRGRKAKPKDADDPLRDPILDGFEGDGPEDGEGEEEGDEEDGEADEDDGEGDDEDDGELDLNRKVSVTVAGVPQEVTLKEVINGYSREADYRQKTAALAEERGEVEEYAREVVAERGKLEATIQELSDLVDALKPSEEDWAKIKKENPALALELREQWDATQKKLDAAKAKRGEIAQRNEDDAQRQHRDYVRTENRKLLEKVPALANPKAAKQFRATIFKGGQEIGYSAEEIANGAVNHRDILTLYYASRYLEIQRSRKSGNRGRQDKTTREPRPSPSSKAPARVTTSRASRQVDGANRVADHDRRLQRSGSMHDAAMAFSEDLRRR